MPFEAINHPATPPFNRVWPEGFLWGSATAAAQVEGASHEGGKEDSVWDAFARVPGAIANGETPEGRGAALPPHAPGRQDHEGAGPGFLPVLHQLVPRPARAAAAANAEGLDFYSRLVDELLDAGILPWLTLYHWDLPQALEEKGGWANRDTAYRFVDYANDVYSALGDRVQHWTTFNEPFCSSLLGYAAGVHAPGRQEPRSSRRGNPPPAPRPRPGGQRAAGPRRPAVGDHAQPQQLHPAGSFRPRGPRCGTPVRFAAEQDLPRSDPPRRVPGGHAQRP